MTAIPAPTVQAALEAWTTHTQAGASEEDAMRAALAAGVLALAADTESLNAARRAVEDALVAHRDAGISVLGRHNGLVIRYADGGASDAIRLTTEEALSIGLRAMAEPDRAAVDDPVLLDLVGTIHALAADGGLVDVDEIPEWDARTIVWAAIDHLRAAGRYTDPDTETVAGEAP